MFYFSYFGSKAKEMKIIREHVDFTGITHIVEPFCGSCAFSRHFFDEGVDAVYHMNDIDLGLINLLKQIKSDGGSKKILNAIKKDIVKYDNVNDVVKNMSEHKIYGAYIKKLTMARFDKYRVISRCYDYTKYRQTDDFVMDANFTCDDYTKVFKKYRDDEKAFLFLDPPYLDSYNRGYYSDRTDSLAQDGTRVFIEIMEYLKVCKCKVLMIINKNSITDYLYSDWIVGEYDKLYQSTKRQAKHLIIMKY